MLRLELLIDDVNLLYSTGYRTVKIDKAYTLAGTCISGTLGCYDPFVLSEYVALTDLDIPLFPGKTYYATIDPEGTHDDWYRWYYTKDSELTSYSGIEFFGPEKGSLGDVYYSPLYPPETELSIHDRYIIKRIRTVVGDPVKLMRDYGELMYANLHDDYKTYEFNNKMWPVDINVNGINYNLHSLPVVHNYKFLSFLSVINEPVTVSGIDYSIDIWYYNFRHSDREIIEQFNICPVPIGLTIKSCPEEGYILQTSIDLLMKESFEDSIEAAASVSDEGTSYSPDFSFRQALLDALNKKLDDLIKQYKLYSGGVRIE